jgi:hypothetical protein
MQRVRRLLPAMQKIGFPGRGQQAQLPRLIVASNYEQTHLVRNEELS